MNMYQYRVCRMACAVAAVVLCAVVCGPHVLKAGQEESGILEQRIAVLEQQHNHTVVSRRASQDQPAVPRFDPAHPDANPGPRSNEQLAKKHRSDVGGSGAGERQGPAYVVATLHIFNQKKAEESSLLTKKGVAQSEKYNVRDTMWWKSLHSNKMNGLILHDGGLKEEEDSELVKFVEIPQKCFDSIPNKDWLHPFDNRWFVVDCVFEDVFAPFEFTVLTDLGDVEFMKDLAPFFTEHADKNLFLFQETDVHHPFQTQRFHTCFGDSRLIGDNIPFNGGFQAGKSGVIRELARGVMAVLQKLIADKNTKCLDLSCDQAVLNKVVYADMEKWRPFTAGDLHPPYAQPMCRKYVAAIL